MRAAYASHFKWSCCSSGTSVPTQGLGKILSLCCLAACQVSCSSLVDSIGDLPSHKWGMHGCAQLDADNILSCTSLLRICGFRLPAVCQRWHVIVNIASWCLSNCIWARLLVCLSPQTTAPGIDRSKSQLYVGFEQCAPVIYHDAKRHVVQLLSKLLVPVYFSGLSFGRLGLCRALGLGCSLHAAIQGTCSSASLPDGTQLCSGFGACIAVCLPQTQERQCSS